MTNYRKDKGDPTKLANLEQQVLYLRENWFNDGAEGETVHAVCAAVEALQARVAELSERLEASETDRRDLQREHGENVERALLAEAKVRELEAAVADANRCELELADIVKRVEAERDDADKERREWKRFVARFCEWIFNGPEAPRPSRTTPLHRRGNRP